MSELHPKVNIKYHEDMFLHVLLHLTLVYQND